MNNPRLTKKKQVQILVALTILAWATQTLLKQWGFGQVVTPTLDAQADMPGASEQFVPSAANSSPSGTLELRQDASVAGADVALKQVCRWSDADGAVFTPISDLTVYRMPTGVGFQSVSVEQIRQTLHDAGVNIAMINFAGATACNITRSDGQTSNQQTVEQWLDSQQPHTVKVVPASLTEVKPDPNYHVLRDLLTVDLSQRLNIPVDTLQITFSAQDEKVLSLAEPIFKFDIRPSRARMLGNVSWEVTIVTDSTSKKVTIQAVARAWEDQVVVARALTTHEVLQASDFSTRRQLVDSLPEHPMLRLEQCVGQEAAEDLQPGTVMTCRLVNPVPLVKPGQLVTVNLRRGTIELRAVARAMETGSLGQTIRVRNENTRDVLDVTVTGPQEARLGDGDDSTSRDQVASSQTPSN
jgi:flagella basal body P-ring formation protein FlgA